jgi:hypothetical protein
LAKGFKTGGRKPGTPNKFNATLKEAILLAAESAHPEGLVGYLKQQATENAAAFMSLLGKTLSREIEGDLNVRATLEDLVLASLKPRQIEPPTIEGEKTWIPPRLRR